MVCLQSGKVKVQLPLFGRNSLIALARSNQRMIRFHAQNNFDHLHLAEDWHCFVIHKAGRGGGENTFNCRILLLRAVAYDYLVCIYCSKVVSLKFRKTAKTFYAASIFFEVCRQFGPLPLDVSPAIHSCGLFLTSCSLSGHDSK